MTKGKDNSEQVRIRTEYAEYIRAESERLGKSFLSTLYWMVDNYRAQQVGIQPSKPVHQIEEKPINKPINKPIELTDENLLDNLDDFQ